MDDVPTPPWLLEYFGFLAGTGDPTACAATWRYVEAPSFGEWYSLEASSGTHMVKRNWHESASTKAARFPLGEPNTIQVAELDAATWRCLCDDFAGLSFQLPAFSDSFGNDGTMHGLQFGGIQDRVSVLWWSEYADAVSPVVDMATKWRDRLLNLKWRDENA